MLRPRVLILTGYDAAFAPIAALTVPRMQAYAARHGYDFRFTQTDEHRGRKPNWIKITLIRKALAEDPHDLVVWIDADAVIVRLDAELHELLPSDADLGMVWHGGDGPDGKLNRDPAHFNNGVIIIRNGEWARDHFRRVDENPLLRHGLQEQATMMQQLGFDRNIGIGPDRPDAPDRAHVARLDPAWNAIPRTATVADPIIQHWAGLREERADAIAADVSLLPLRDACGDQARLEIARLMSSWYDQASRIDQIERRLERILRSPRRLLQSMPAALRARWRAQWSRLCARF